MDLSRGLGDVYKRQFQRISKHTMQKPLKK
jgi:hypothetical protein